MHAPAAVLQPESNSGASGPGRSIDPVASSCPWRQATEILHREFTYIKT